MNDRLAWHSDIAEQRDLRFQGWNAKKVVAWQVEVRAWLATPDERTLAEMKALAWISCPSCSRDYQPGPNSHRSCYTCSNAEYRAGSTACTICQRRHSVSFPCCRNCQTAGREDQASLIREITLRRDHYACNVCGTADGHLDVHHILPEGSAFAWNTELLCVPCGVILAASKAVSPLDELVWLERAQAYSTYLAEYLTTEERDVLAAQLKDQLGGDYMAAPPRFPYGAGTCDAVEGLVNVLDCFGRDGITISHV